MHGKSRDAGKKITCPSLYPQVTLRETYKYDIPLLKLAQAGCDYRHKMQ